MSTYRSDARKRRKLVADLIPLTQAAERIGSSMNTLRKVIRNHDLVVYANPLDARERLIDADELEAAIRPVPIRRRATKPDEGKAAA